MANELKPCPFCGCTDIRKITTLTHTQIYCSDCMCGVTRGLLLGKCDTLKEAEEYFGVEAIETWNRRV